jgi:hypothetical protein
LLEEMELPASPTPPPPSPPRPSSHSLHSPPLAIVLPVSLEDSSMQLMREAREVELDADAAMIWTTCAPVPSAASWAYASSAAAAISSGTSLEHATSLVRATHAEASESAVAGLCIHELTAAACAPGAAIDAASSAQSISSEATGSSTLAISSALHVVSVPTPVHYAAASVPSICRALPSLQPRSRSRTMPRHPCRHTPRCLRRPSLSWHLRFSGMRRTLWFECEL